MKKILLAVILFVAVSGIALAIHAATMRAVKTQKPSADKTPVMVESFVPEAGDLPGCIKKSDDYKNILVLGRVRDEASHFLKSRQCIDATDHIDTYGRPVYDNTTYGTICGIIQVRVDVNQSKWKAINDKYQKTNEGCCSVVCSEEGSAYAFIGDIARTSLSELYMECDDAACNLPKGIWGACLNAFGKYDEKAGKTVLGFGDPEMKEGKLCRSIYSWMQNNTRVRVQIAGGTPMCEIACP